jgi:hypothetical protein
MTESLLDRFEIDEPVVFRYGLTTSQGRESSGGAILAHRDPSKSQFAGARDLEDLMNAGVNVQQLLADALKLAQEKKTVPNLRDASRALHLLATRMTEDEFRREAAIEKKGVDHEELARQIGDHLHVGGEYYEGRTQEADRHIGIARELVGVSAKVTPNLDDEPDLPSPTA